MVRQSVKSLSLVDEERRARNKNVNPIHGEIIDATRCRDIVQCMTVLDVLQQLLLKPSLRPLHPRFTVCSPFNTASCDNGIFCELRVFTNRPLSQYNQRFCD